MRGRRGMGWEAKLDHQHDQYRKAERNVVVFKAHPEVKVVDGRAIRKKGPPDYIGRAGPRPVCFDAKSGQGRRWGFGKLERHQAISLEAYAKAPNAIVGIALRLKDHGTWWIPWSVLGPLWWAWFKSEDDYVASVDVRWLNEHAVQMVGADWLAVVSS